MPFDVCENTERYEPPELWRRQLLEAADLLEQRGHTKGVLVDPLGRVCALGALNTVMAGGAFSWPSAACHLTINLATWPLPYRAVGQVIGAHSPRDIADWNNEDCRTAEEVVAAFRAAAKLKGEDLGHQGDTERRSDRQPWGFRGIVFFETIALPRHLSPGSEGRDDGLESVPFLFGWADRPAEEVVSIVPGYIARRSGDRDRDSGRAVAEPRSRSREPAFS